MTGDRLSRILAALSAGGDAWSSARLCAVCPGIVGVNGAGDELPVHDLVEDSVVPDAQPVTVFVRVQRPCRDRAFGVVLVRRGPAGRARKGVESSPC